MNELLPCPFCGNEAERMIESSYFAGGCTNEDCGAATLWHVDSDKAIAAWNRRATIDRNSSRPTGVRAGLLRGRVRKKGVQHPDSTLLPFYRAVEEASADDLRWALNLLVKHPNAKRTFRKQRINAIAYRLEEIAGAEILERREGTP